VLFIIFSTDKPDSQALRAATRAAHIEYLDRYRNIIVLGGGMLTDDGKGHIGSTIIVNVPGRAEAEAFAHSEPFFKAGLYEEQRILRMRKGYWNPDAAPRTAQDD
jgi:uncharacterized protein YciI